MKRASYIYRKSNYELFAKISVFQELKTGYMKQ